MVREQFEKDGFIVLKQHESWIKIHTEIDYQFKRIFMGNTINKIPEVLCWNIGQLNKIQKIDRVHLLSQSVRELINAKELITYITKLTGAKKIQLYSSHLFFKPPGSGEKGNIGWHTDLKNIVNDKLNIIVACIPLGAISQHSGNMRVLQGSHLWQGNSNHTFNDGSITNLPKQQQQIKAIMPSKYQWQECFAYNNSTEFSLHHGNVWHCSGPNESMIPRLSLSISMHIQHTSTSYCLPDLVMNPIIFDGKKSK